MWSQQQLLITSLILISSLHYGYCHIQSFTDSLAWKRQGFKEKKKKILEFSTEMIHEDVKADKFKCNECGWICKKTFKYKS